MRDFRSLDVWHKSHALTLHLYRITDSFPKQETFGLAATIRRWAANMTMKIAEACGRDLTVDYVASLKQSRGVATELEYQLLLTRDLRILANDAYDPIQADLIEVRKMLTGLIRSQGL